MSDLYGASGQKRFKCKVHKQRPLNPFTIFTIFIRHYYYRAYGVNIFSDFEIRPFRVVENMERPAPDCKGRHKSIKLMRHGGALPPIIADYRLAATEPHTIERSRS